jgi:hypothetical protein
MGSSNAVASGAAAIGFDAATGGVDGVGSSVMVILLLAQKPQLFASVKLSLKTLLFLHDSPRSRLQSIRLTTDDTDTHGFED